VTVLCLQDDGRVGRAQDHCPQAFIGKNGSFTVLRLNIFLY